MVWNRSGSAAALDLKRTFGRHGCSRMEIVAVTVLDAKGDQTIRSVSLPNAWVQRLLKSSLDDLLPRSSFFFKAAYAL